MTKAIKPGTAEPNPFTEVQKKIASICRQLNIPEGISARLQVCESEFIVNFPLLMDDGSYKIFTGYRIQHNDKAQLTSVMENAFAEVLDVSERRDVEMRDAAYMLAIQRVASAMMIRGIYP